MTTAQTTDSIRFFQWHKPSLLAGNYEIEATQTVTPDEQTGALPSFSTKMAFSVGCERFALPPTEIHAVFPPDGSMGDHAHVLPHVVLRRSTLPWERRAEEPPPHNQDAPWLALLVFHEGEIGEPETVSLDTVENAPGVKFHGYASEGEPGNTKLTVIDVKKELLESIMPRQENSRKELELLAHARVRRHEGGEGKAAEEMEVAVIMANRLPKAGGFSTAHLVSVEGHYKNGGYDYLGAESDEKIRLVSLLSFRFACLDPKRSFTELLQGLDGATSARPVSTLRLPEKDYPAANEEARKQLELGSVPMRHSMRQGKKTVSWYHGPLSPVKTPPSSATGLPVSASDGLLRFSGNSGMFDVSYAAAWEIGRLLALQSKKFSVELYRWKQTCARLHHPTQLQPCSLHPLSKDLPETVPLTPLNPPLMPDTVPLTLLNPPLMPEQIKSWLIDLSLLKGVPFSYLVPDEHMLPMEAIRIFRLDDYWLDCLLDGAQSIGETAGFKQGDSRRVYSVDLHGPVTGVILRSEVVSGWPGLQVDGYSGGKLLSLLRTERLSPSVLICFFNGEIGEVRIHQKLETLHFGLDKKLEKKMLRLGKTGSVDLAWRNRPKSILDIDALAKAMGSEFTSAEFALQMIEGVEEVKFVVSLS